MKRCSTWRNRHRQSFHRLQIKRKNVVKSPDNGNCILPIHYWTWTLNTVYACMHSAQVFVCVCEWSTRLHLLYSLQYVNIGSRTLTKSLLLYCMHECDVVVRQHRQHYASNKKIGGKRWKFPDVSLFSQAFVNGKSVSSAVDYKLVGWLFMILWIDVMHFLMLSALTEIWILAQAFNRFNSFLSPTKWVRRIEWMHRRMMRIENKMYNEWRCICASIHELAGHVDCLPDANLILHFPFSQEIVVVVSSALGTCPLYACSVRADEFRKMTHVIRCCWWQFFCSRLNRPIFSVFVAMQKVASKTRCVIYEAIWLHDISRRPSPICGLGLHRPCNKSMPFLTIEWLYEQKWRLQKLLDLKMSAETRTGGHLAYVLTVRIWIYAEIFKWNEQSGGERIIMGKFADYAENGWNDDAMEEEEKKRQDFPDDNDGLCVNSCVTTSYTWLNRKAQIWSLLFIAIRFMYARCGRSTFYSSTYRSVLIYICFFSSSLVRRGTTHFVAQLAVKYLTSQFPLLSYSNKNTKLEKKNANWFARHSAEFGIIQ